MKLYKRDFEFLLKNIKDFALLEKLKAYSVDRLSKESLEIIFSEEELDVLEDELARLLWEVGVSENDEVNAQGRYIESLIDLISDEYE